MIYNVLYYRKKLLGSDVCEALENLVDMTKLPMALNKQQVLYELIKISCTLDDGTKVPQSAIAKEGTYDRILSSLKNSTVFQKGYELYGSKYKIPVVPVTLYFFDNVFVGNSSLVKTLENMSDMRVVQSLPKRPSRSKYDNGALGSSSGKVEGVIVYPSNHVCALLRYWQIRRLNVMKGQMTGTLGFYQRVNPCSKRIANAKVVGRKIVHNARLSLPLSKKK